MPPSLRTKKSAGKKKSPATLVATFQVLTSGSLGMAVVLALLPGAGHDQLWFLLMAQRWLHGAVLYGPQAFDSNTPAIVWISAIPVGLAEHLHLSLPFTAKLMMTLLEAAVGVFSLRILERLPLGSSLTAGLSPAARWYLGFVFVTLFAVVPARDFGQRDLIVALLCLPYILAAAQVNSTRRRMVTVLLAAAGICLKPQLVLVAIAVEAAVLVLSGGRRKALRMEPVLLLLAGGLFFLAIHRFAPLYLSQAVPTTLLSYWAIGHLRAGQLFAQAIQLHVLCAIVLALLPRTLRTRSDTRVRLRPALLLLAIAGLAAIAAYYQQATGWYYQQLPGITLLGLALAFELLILTEGLFLAEGPRRTPHAWLPRTAAVLALLSVGLTLHFSGYPITQDRAYAITSPDPSFFAGLAPGTSIATLTTSVDDAIEPVFRYHLIWAQRTNNLWMLPAILRATSPTLSVTPPPRLNAAALAMLTAQQRRWMVEDLTRWRPQLVLVARCQSPTVHCQELEDRHDDLLAFFLADPEFRVVWQHYRPLRSAGDYDAYVRTDE